MQVHRLYKEFGARQDRAEVKSVAAKPMTFKALMNGGAAFTLTVMIRKAVTGLVFILLGLPFAIAASKPNIVLITIDSGRTDRMGFMGAKGALTPNLNRLAAESIVFDHAYAQAPGCVVSHATILSGAYPQSTGMSEIGGTLIPSLPYLPELLKAQGYRTAAFVGSIHLDPANGLAQGLDRGFQRYDTDFRPEIPGDSRPPITERRGTAFVGSVLAWLVPNAKYGPFFLWVHLSDGDAASGASYDAAIAAADAAVGHIVSTLKEQKITGNTAIIVVADHGQSLGAHGEDTHGIFLYDETIHVPLLLKLPEASAAKAPTHVAAKVRLVDIAPTLLEIAGIPVPSQMFGQSLLRAAKSGGGADQPVFSRRPAPARIRLEPSGIMAGWQVSLRPCSEGRTLRSDRRPGSDA